MSENELTEREQEVLYYLTQGLMNKEMADVLSVTHHTVKAHISSIIRKLKCKNRTEAALFAERNNLVIPPQD